MRQNAAFCGNGLNCLFHVTQFNSFFSLQEIPENGADVAHLKQVHTPVIAAGINLSNMWNRYLSFAWHSWTAQWTQNPAPEEHIGSLKLTHDLTLFGFSTRLLFLSVSARQVGKKLFFFFFFFFTFCFVFFQYYSMFPLFHRQIRPLKSYLIYPLLMFTVQECNILFSDREITTQRQINQLTNIPGTPSKPGTNILTSHPNQPTNQS